MSRDLLRNVPVPELVEAYQEAVREVKSYVKQLHNTVEKIYQIFGYDYTIQYGDHKVNEFEGSTLTSLKRMAWKRLIDMSHIRQILSIQKLDQLDKQLDKEIHSMPDLTVENVYATFLEFARSSDTYLRQSALEVFDILTPGRRISMRDHKTNMKNPFSIQEKIILKHYCRHVGRRMADDSYKMVYEVNGYYSSGYIDGIVAIDKMFHVLDGKTLPQGGSPLLQAINTTGENPIGETEYFKFKCFKGNKSWDSGGNLHLTIKRMDLAEKLAAYASEGDKLQGEINERR